ncbi:DNA primase [Parabacteroides merdae]|uniref:DNA primase n=1 Tax=Parabacteroides merdae TaxID=46503 RepID=UPI0022E61FE3|nr:CHC2 zinc finger domain-containing protein [Parabacteroides merdae]
MRGDSLKERLLRVATIEDVVAAYVPLQRSGAGYVGLCPFHADKHPSLHVHPGKQFFKCFACGEGGDLFAFVQKIEGCSFTEAMGKLAKRYSIDSREWTVDNYAGKKKRTDGKGMAGKGTAGKETTGEGTTGKKTDGRGTAGFPDRATNENSDDQLSVVHSQLSIRTIGAANRLFASLLQPYVPEDEALRETYRLFGVGIAPPEVPADYRKMRSRLIFPIRDEKGGLVAFAARRRTDGEEGAKYVNSPASPVYSKSRVLYALDLAGEAIRERRFVFVTEGYKDALAMHAAGFTNTVALCGVAFTAGHLRLLAGYTQRIVLLLDADRAGEASMEKIVAMLSCGTDPEGERLEPACLFEVSRMQLPYGEDPDSLLHGSGFVSFRRQITASLHLALLETYEHRLLRQIAKTVSDLSLCLSCEDRISLLSLLAKQKSRLSRVTMRLGRNVVV